MIIDLILQVLKVFLDFILSPFMSAPDAVLDPNLTSAIANIQGFITSVDPIFPITTLLACLSIILGIELAIFLYKGIMWLIKKIPGIS